LRREEVVTIEIEVIAPQLDVGGTKPEPPSEARSPRERRESGAVPEETASSGEPQTA